MRPARRAVARLQRSPLRRSPLPRSPLLRSSLLAAALFTLSACGISPTGVVQAGDAASGIKPTTLLYFVVNGPTLFVDGPTLVAVPRTSTEPVVVEKAVAMVFMGPEVLKGSDLPEQFQGLTTQLPPLSTENFNLRNFGDLEQKAYASKVRTDGDTVSIELPPTFRSPLRGMAADQLICTAAMAHLMTNPDLDKAKVTVTGSTDAGPWRREGSSTTCPGQQTPTEAQPANTPRGAAS
ncbi:hypothetical protein [Streptomyces cavernae]|uniref:hypothetical protein n=1 Tax=Streptomyces cavernae TaxID=2259034 RepID=UPI000FEC0DC2|nr:hypothetical protein [Streptomyces cavernae]